MASIEYIEGIGPALGKKYRGAGVRGTKQLLNRGMTKKGRKELAEATGISEGQVLEHVNRADLMRVKGVGSEYSDLLEAAGVDSPMELKNRNAKNLYEKMAEVNSAKKLVRRPPSLPEVEAWVANAKTLEACVTH